MGGEWRAPQRAAEKGWSDNVCVSNQKICRKVFIIRQRRDGDVDERLAAFPSVQLRSIRSKDCALRLGEIKFMHWYLFKRWELFRPTTSPTKAQQIYIGPPSPPLRLHKIMQIISIEWEREKEASREKSWFRVYSLGWDKAIVDLPMAYIQLKRPLTSQFSKLF